MAQISRPFQIALAVVVLFAGVWLFVLQGHSSSGSSGSSGASASAPVASSSSPSTSAPAAHAASGASKASDPSPATASSTHVYHGPAPGVEGLTRAIVKAHQAVGASGEAPQQPSGSSRASAPAATASAPSAKTASPSSSASTKATHPKSATSAQATSSSTPSTPSTSKSSAAPRSTAPKTSSSTTAPARQKAIEADLKAGTPVVVLFWNPKGAEDVVDHRALAQLVHNDVAGHRSVAVQEATASQVAEFGSITRGVQIDATPTILVIGPHDQAIVLTGVQDAFAIEQTIEEALHPQPQS
jgi:hypothetical protein